MVLWTLSQDCATDSRFLAPFALAMEALGYESCEEIESVA